MNTTLDSTIERAITAALILGRAETELAYRASAMYSATPSTRANRTTNHNAWAKITAAADACAVAWRKAALTNAPEDIHAAKVADDAKEELENCMFACPA